MIARRLCAILCAVLCAVVLSTAAAHAQRATAPAEPDTPWAAWEAEAARAEDSILGGAASSEALGAVRSRLTVQVDEARVIQAEAEREVERLEREITALGEAPEDGMEADEIAALRARVASELAASRATVVQARYVTARAQNLLLSLAELTQGRFLERMLSRTVSPLNPLAWARAQEALSKEFGRLVREYRREFGMESADQSLVPRILTALAFIAAALLILLGLKRLANRILVRYVESARERSGRLWLGVGAAVIRIVLGLIISVLLIIAVALLSPAGPVSERIGRGLATALIYVIAGYTLISILFSLNSGRLRLVSLSDRDAQAAFRWSMILVVAAAISVAVESLLDADGGADVAATLGFIPIALAALALFCLARMINRPVDEPDGAGAESATDWQGLTLARWLLMIVAVAAPVLALSRFGAAAEYFIAAMTWSIAAIAVAYTLYAAIVAATAVLIGDRDQDGGRFRLIPIFVGFVLFCAVLPVLALVWGADAADLGQAWAVISEGFEIGDVVLAPVDFAMFALVFGIGYGITRMVQRTLKGSVLPKAGMSAGGSAALVSGIGYIGVFLAAIAAISATGLDLSNLAIVAGALSVGIGFGLQTIVNNFVSGVILLVERPIKVGDWIEVGGVHGTVRKVNVRSTEIETFDRSSYIMPNSDLIAGAVTNYTLSDTVGRVIAPIGVAYGVDPRLVERLLLEVASAHPMVLASPAPSAYFMNFGADALEFELRAYLRDVNWVLTVRSDLNFKISERFTEEGIEIPFAQRDLNVRNPEALAEAFRSVGGPTAFPRPTPPEPDGKG